MKVVFKKDGIIYLYSETRAESNNLAKLREQGIGVVEGEPRNVTFIIKPFPPEESKEN